jgi:PAS domain S-box-containing protein
MIPSPRVNGRETGALDVINAALARSGDGGFATGPDGRIVAWNRGAERILESPADEVIGKTCCEVFAGHDAAGNRLCYPGCHIRSLVRMAEPVCAYDLRTRTRSGRVVWINVSVLPLALDGAAVMTVHLFRDITATHEVLAGTRNGATHEAVASTLTRRESEILRLLGEGLGTAAAAGRLHVSRATVRNHIQNIFAKLGVHSRLEAVAHATRHYLL